MCSHGIPSCGTTRGPHIAGDEAEALELAERPPPQLRAVKLRPGGAQLFRAVSVCEIRPRRCGVDRRATTAPSRHADQFLGKFGRVTTTYVFHLPPTRPWGDARLFSPVCGWDDVAWGAREELSAERKIEAGRRSWCRTFARVILATNQTNRVGLSA